MAGVLIRFPGGACRYYVQGRCLRPEMLNPGLQREHVCSEVQLLDGPFDDMLTRVEAFGLPEDESMEIMERRLERLGRQNPCPRKAPKPLGEPLPGDRDVPDCIHARGHVCLLHLPVCLGVCRHYAPGRAGMEGEEENAP